MRSFAELYFELEREFVEVCEVVPYERNPAQVYSPRFYSILQTAGALVDGLLKGLANLRLRRVRSDKFPALYTALNAGGVLPTLKLVPMKGGAPFTAFDRNPPDWWTAYNNSKHKLPEGQYESRLGTTLRAIGGAYVLLRIGTVLVAGLSRRSVIGERSDFPDCIFEEKSWLDIPPELERGWDTPVRRTEGGGERTIGSARRLGTFASIDDLAIGRESQLFLSGTVLLLR